MKSEIFFHKSFTKHMLTRNHPERPERLTASLDRLKTVGLLDNPHVEVVSPDPASKSDIISVHDSDYVQQVEHKSNVGGGYFTLDTSVNSFTYEAAVHAVGAGISAVKRILEEKACNAFVLCRPPGHHAERNRAFGFCFFNNIAIAAQHLTAKGDIKKVMIVDFDAHHGNGTQNAFYDRADVLYIGLHQDGRTLFPGSGFPNEIGEGDGRGYNINIAMYPGAGDKSYSMAFDEIVIPVTESYAPDFILVSCGFDAHFSDPLTSLGLTTKGYAMMNAKINDLSNTISEGRLAYFLEGGYDIDIMQKGTVNLVEELIGHPVTRFDDSHSESNIAISHTQSIIEVLKEQLEGIHF